MSGSHLFAPRARVRLLPGLLEEAVGELQRQEALLVVGQLLAARLQVTHGGLPALPVPARGVQER